jgi:hypothetical protein
VIELHQRDPNLATSPIQQPVCQVEGYHELNLVENLFDGDSRSSDIDHVFQGTFIEGLLVRVQPGELWLGNLRCPAHSKHSLGTIFHSSQHLAPSIECQRPCGRTERGWFRKGGRCR